MSITDELRHNIKGAEQLYGRECTRLIAIADRIDAEYQKALDEWKAECGQMWLKGYSECHAELLEGNEILASDLESCGWIRLPKDADGEYIHVGERVQLIGNDPSTVSHMSLADDGWRVYVKYDGGIGTGSGEPKRIRHYHAPTVEDVLREFANEVYADADNEIRDRDFLCAKYAKRLTLAEGEDA